MGLSNFRIGVDIENVPRFDKYRLARDSAFLRKIYTDEELEYCFSKERPAPHLAARFAAKEAVIKALSGLDVSGVRHREIEVRKDGRGGPTIACKNGGSWGYAAQVSLSHSKDQAIAFVILTEIPDHD
jgi:holo-[acyl-carrier protein] synthase